MTLVARGPSQADTADPGEPSTGKPRLSISELDADVLRVLAAGRTVVELGTGLGVSTRALAETAQTVATIDVDPWVQKNIWPGLPGDVLRLKDRNQIHLADLVFIDADHSTEAVREDIAYALTLNPELVVCHDSNYPNVKAALDGVWLHIRTEHGLAVQYQ